MNIDSLAALVTVAVAVAGGLSGLLGHWLARRAASGRVATSEASVLWEQTQDMRHLLQDRLNRAEEQRDRLIESYTQQVLPMLSSINQLVTDLSATMSEGVTMVRSISDELHEGGASELEAQAAEPPAAV
jgi:chromosome condensin MukBEF ATPase and DNA-binding subunit MukB